MRRLFIIFSLFFFTNCEAQTFKDGLQKRAFDFFIESRYDSALYLYKLVDDQFPGDHYVLFQIGKSYSYLGNMKMAKIYFSKVLNMFEKDPDHFIYSSAALGLADVLIDEQNFNEALLYLNVSKTKYKPKRRMCLGGLGSIKKLEFAYKKSLCFFGLGYKDSAVKNLLPLIFKPALLDMDFDSTEYDKISRFFANAVFEVYGKEKARNMLLQSVENTFYNLNRRMENKLRPLTFDVTCYLYYLDHKIVLGTDSYTDFEKDEPVPKEITKAAFLKLFTDSPPYCYITHPTDIIITHYPMQELHLQRYDLASMYR